jgi:integrase
MVTLSRPRSRQTSWESPKLLVFARSVKCSFIQRCEYRTQRCSSLQTSMVIASVALIKKNQKAVFIPIPPHLKQDLDRLPLNGGYYFLIGDSENVHTQTDAWRTILNQLFKKDMPGFHAHRFRHTAAVNWLASGLTLEEVADLLGNSVKVVEKHYASFCGPRQTRCRREVGQGVGEAQGPT